MEREIHPRISVKDFGTWQSRRQSKKWEGSRGIHHPYTGFDEVSRKSNTCHRRSAAIKERLIDALTAHIERHPNDGASKARLMKAKAA